MENKKSQKGRWRQNQRHKTEMGNTEMGEGDGQRRGEGQGERQGGWKRVKRGRDGKRERVTRRPVCACRGTWRRSKRAQGGRRLIIIVIIRSTPHSPPLSSEFVPDVPGLLT